MSLDGIFILHVLNVANVIQQIEIDANGCKSFEDIIYLFLLNCSGLMLLNVSFNLTVGAIM